MSNTILFALVCGLAGVIYGIITAMWVNKQDAGNAKMIEISNAILENRHVRKEVEMLKHHADLSPHFIDALDVAG